MVTDHYTGKYGDNIRDGCGIFKVATRVNEEVECGAKIFADYPWIETVKRDFAVAAIEKYCSEELILDQAAEEDPFQENFKKGRSSETYLNSGLDSSSVIRMQATSYDNMDCQPREASARKASSVSES